MQNLYNLLYREEEREMMPTLKVRFSPATLLGPTKHSVTMEQLFGVRSIPWSPLGRGLLCRPFNAMATLRKKTDG